MGPYFTHTHAEQKERLNLRTFKKLAQPSQYVDLLDSTCLDLAIAKQNMIDKTD